MRAGESSREIAEALGRPLATVRKWRQRYQRGGRKGLSCQMGRAAAGALAKASEERKDALLELREKHPGWGAQTLRLEIAKDERFAGLTIPSRVRIAAYLKEQKKVGKNERHQDLPEPQAQPVQRPHQERLAFSERDPPLVDRPGRSGALHSQKTAAGAFPD